MSAPDDEVPQTAHGAGCYLYAVVDGDATDVRGLPGIEPGGSVDAMTVGDITAVVSAVDMNAMREGGASADVGEDSWLARAVRRHEQVVLAAFRSARTVPVRFGIVHACPASVERLLTTYGAQLREELSRLGEAGEWNLKAFADRDVLAHRASETEAEDHVADSGRGYLLRERARRDVDARIREIIAARAATLIDEVSSVARELAPLPFGGDESRRGVIAAVCLVDRAAEHRLTSVIESYAEAVGPQGVTVELTGPWPPYHFTSLRLGSNDG
jgi:hypothetical protein